MKKNLFYLLMLILVFFSCKETTMVSEQESQQALSQRVLNLSKNKAKLIRGITTGIINPDGEIVVEFYDPIVTKEQLNQSLSKSPFNFSPTIAGEAKWTNPNILKFKPLRKFKLRDKYQASLDLGTIFPKAKFEDDEKFINFNFEISGREILDFKSDFEVTNTEKNWVAFKGELEFSCDTDYEELQKSLKCYGAGEIRLTINQLAGSKRKFIFVSENIQRGTQGGYIRIVLDKSNLDLTYDKDYQFYIPPVRVFNIARYDRFVKAEDKDIKILFSDVLDENFNLDGFLEITPKVNFKPFIKDKYVILKGDFQPGVEYTIKFRRGLSSKWGSFLEKDTEVQVAILDYLPSISFLNEGSFMTSASSNKLLFKSKNVKKINYQIYRVFEKNIPFFLQSNDMYAYQNEGDYYFPDVNRTGELLYDQNFEIGEEKNKSITTEIDLSKVITQSPKGCYLIKINYQKDDILFNKPLNLPSNFFNYYEDPTNYSYYYNKGSIVKSLLITDLGLIAKKTNEGYHVFTVNILNANPVENATVKSYSYQNRLIEEVSTDQTGRALLTKNTDNVFFIVGESQNNKTIIKLNEFALDKSAFNTGGTHFSSAGIKAFIYTERGVYRPGDELNLSFILRNQEGSFPKDHPVKIQVFNPKNQMVEENVLKKSEDGFYNYSFKTNLNDYTGTYNFKLIAGSQVFNKNVKIETIVPYKIKVRSKLDKKDYNLLDDQTMKLTVLAKYYFGTLAKNHKAKVEMILFEKKAKFKKFANFFFGNELKSFPQTRTTLFDGNLNSKGEVELNTDLPNLDNISSKLGGVIVAEVLEKGGRPVINKNYFTVSKYKNYVGILAPSSNWLKSTAPAEFGVILVNENGEPISDRKLSYKIYVNKRYWWYDYEGDNNASYKNDYNTELLEEGEITTKSIPVNIKFTPNTYGRMFIEVTDKNSNHSAGVFFRAYSWGDTGGKNVSMLNLKSDQESYFVGDTAKIAFKAAANSKLLVSIEKNDKILDYYWQDQKEEETVLKIPLTKEMVPNAYISVTSLQELAKSKNDLPLRLFGIKNITVKQKNNKIPLEVITSESFRPNENFEIKVKTKDNSNPQLTIAVVDEGLLDLTNFTIPSPLKFFFAKEMLLIKTYDMFNKILRVPFAKINRSLKVGGGMLDEFAAKAEKLKNPIKVKRFKPISFFSGPVKCQNGEANFSFKMPDFVGSVRIMVIAADKNHYGKETKSVPVKSELLGVISLPRVIGAGDSFNATLTAMSLVEGLGKAKVSLEVKSPLKIMGESVQEIDFKNLKDEKDLTFNIKAEDKIGKTQIVLKITSDKYSFHHTTDIAVKPQGGLVKKSSTEFLDQGKSLKLDIPKIGIEGTNDSYLVISKLKNLNLDERLQYLIRYPYGCIEQTTSSVFPQLLLRNVYIFDSKTEANIDNNINEAIKKLKKFQLRSGAFAYWQGNPSSSNFGTVYATHFLIKAKKMGYFIPDYLLNGALKYLKVNKFTNFNQNNLNNNSYFLAAYRLYVLALNDDYDKATMNLLKENYLPYLSKTATYLLAASYKLAGSDQVATELLKNLGIDLGDKDAISYNTSYGSQLRNKAVILELLVLFDRKNDATKLYDEIVTSLNSDSWYSTQTTAYSLIGISAYLEKYKPSQDFTMKGLITLDGEKVSFDTKDNMKKIKVSDYRKLEVQNTSEKEFFVSLYSEGISLKDQAKNESKNLKITRTFYNEDGFSISPDKLEQGTSIWCYYTVENLSNSEITNVALMQVLPSGWEIENLRFSEEPYPNGLIIRWVMTDLPTTILETIE